MSIKADVQNLRFKLDTPHTTYLIGVTPARQLVNCYYGAGISDAALTGHMNLGDRSYEPASTGSSESECPNLLAYEYGTPGCGDFRSPAISILLSAGHRALDLRYVDCRVTAGKPALSDMPRLFAADGDCDTLEIMLEDTAAQIRVSLFYCVFARLDAIVRWTHAENCGTKTAVLEKLSAASLSLPLDDREYLHLPGAWARERQIERLPLGHSIQSFGSTRGVSGHMQNPFAAVVSRDCGERRGDAYGISLVYSGNFLFELEGDPYDGLRVNAGINPAGFAWVLEAGEGFSAPECVLVYSDGGLGGMSRIFHRLYQNHLCPPAWREKPRPVVLNNWEATYCDFDGDKLVALAGEAAALNIDLLVMDDGWFGKRNDDRTGLGDWTANEKKLGCTLAELARRVNEQGVGFGLWMEPEMISEDSDLYRAHPDWCLHLPRKEKTPARHQFVLDLSREDVLDYCKSAVAAVLESADIRYVKWDFNRAITDAWSVSLPAGQGGEVLHRYICNQYRLAAYLTETFPNVLFEGCAGGGGRFDPAQLYYLPHIWTSDDMDSIERMKIQYGSSLVYPPSTMAAHVCSSPNHTTGRILPLHTRGICAMMGGEFGYELDVSLLTDAEKDEVRGQIADYKAIERLVHGGDYYRLADPFVCNYGAWMFVSADKTECAVTYIQCLSEPNGNAHRILLDGLDPARLYENAQTGERFYGDTLMRAGIIVPMRHADFEALLYRFRAAD